MNYLDSTASREEMESMPSETSAMDIDNEPAAKEERTTDEFNKTLEGTLNRIAHSLPRQELHMIIREAMECEAALFREIRVLEEAAGLPLTPLPDNIMEVEQKMKSTSEESSIPTTTISLSSLLPKEYNPNLQSPVNYLSTADDILATGFAPHDRYFSLSALLGRLREPLTTPPIPHPTNMIVEQQKKGYQRRTSTTLQPGDVSSSSSHTGAHPLLIKHRLLLELRDNPIYTQIYTADQIQSLLTLWKRISNHRTAIVFRKPVNPEEAPGYTDKILFPMDLSLIRKLITNGYIASFQQLHEYLGLICHNCIKFNGRESDYATLARDFEAYVDESILDTIQKLGIATISTTSSANNAVVINEEQTAEIVDSVQGDVME